MKKRLILTLILVLTLILGATALIIGVSASDEEPALEFNGANVSFEESVHLIYSIGYSNVESPENIKLLVWREADVTHIDNLTKGSEQYTLSSMQDPPAGMPENSVAFKFTKIAAAEMTENIYARAYYVEDGKEYYSPVLKYSLLKYAYNKLGITGTASESETLKDMLEGMLEYGALAQKHFGVLTDRLATDPFVKIQVKGATLADGTTSGLFVAGTEDILLTAKPTEALPYVKWTDANGKLLGYGTTFTVKADNHKTIYATPVAEESSFGAYKYVAFIGVDGAGDFWTESTNTPNIDSIFANGAVSYDVKIPSPTSSGPSWTSTLHGVPVENHGVNDNAFVEDATAFEGTDPEPWSLESKYPSFLRVAAENLPEGSSVGAIFGWDAFYNMIEDHDGIYKNSYVSNNQAIKDEENTKMAIDYILEEKPELLFFHFGNVDTVGHGKGFGSADHFAAINTADEQIGRIYAAYEEAGILEDTLFIVTSDHGGTPSGTHGALSDAEKYVMFAATGKTVRENGTISEMYNRDNAAIVLYALGIEAPETYTAIVPNGIFKETITSERKDYNDPDSPRYHITEETPVFGSKDDVTNFVENNLVTYLPFDGSVSATKGAATSTYGTVEFTDGYFGEAVDLSDGHVILSNFKPGTDSFTIAMWMKTPAISLESTVLSNKAKGGSLTGLDFSLRRDTSVGWHQARFNVGYNGAEYLYHDTFLPGDYQYGWTHVILVVDRENATISTIFDFGAFSTASLEGDLTSSTLSAYGLYIGKDANNNPNYPKMDLEIDEFMIFDGAFTRNDVNDLAEYYGKSPVIADEPTVLDKIDTNADVYLNFDNNILSKGTSDVSVDAFGNPNYVAGITGDAINLNNAYLQFPEFKIGKGSYTASFWINPRDLSFAGNNLEYLPLITTQSKYSGYTEGFTLMLNTYNNKIFFNAGNGYTAENGLPQVRINISAPFPDGFEDSWTHIIFSVDKTEGVETVKIYVNFEEVYSGRFVNLHNTSQVFDYTLDNETLTIGQYSNGDYPVYLNAYLDDLIMSTEAISASDVLALKEYYEPYIPKAEATPSVKDVLANAPDIFLDFNGSVSNTGSQDSEVDLNGTASYTDGVDGKAMQLGGTYLQLPEYSLGTDSVSFAFWVNPQDLTYAGPNKEYVPLITTQSVYGGTKAGFTLMMETNNKFFMFNAGNGYTADNGLPKIRFNYCHSFPEGFLQNWTHVAVVIDRTAGAETFTLYINFEKVYNTSFNNMYASEVYSPSLDDQVLTIGQYSTGSFAAPPSAYIDDLIITKGVLTEQDIAAMASYYQSAK